MAVLTEGVITEENRVAVVAGMLESTVPATTRGLVELALKMDVPADVILAAADAHDEGALIETDVTAIIRGYLSECG